MSEDRKQVPALGPKASDRVAAVSGAAVSLVPWAGGALAEVVNEFIPNQRLDRIEKFLTFLHEEVQQRNIPDDKMKSAEGADFVVQGGEQAVRAPSDDKIRYLARCVADGIGSDAQNAADERRLIVIISDLDDRDFLILRAYAVRDFWDQSFRPEQPLYGAPEAEQVKYQLYEAAIERLERYGLLSFRINKDIRTQMPKFDEFSGKPSGYRIITALGERILRRVGMMPSDEEIEAGRPKAIPINQEEND